MIVDRAAAVLAEHGVDSPRVDAEWIVAHVHGVSRSELVARSHELDEARFDEAEVWRLVERRTQREPLAYVLGEWGFRRLTLRCDERALVPRPETEIVAETCIALLRESARGSESQTHLRVLDVGTGTGAIALALADEVPGVEVVATDVSPEALSLARENALSNSLDVQLLQSDLFEGLPPGPFDLVVSNPPYVFAEELDALEPEVRDWEPRDALLDRGQTEALARAALDVLAPGGALVLEIHEERAESTRALLENLGYRVTIGVDLTGRDRVVEGRRVK
jgi:release factor glutamine methyltransferase